MGKPVTETTSHALSPGPSHIRSADEASPAEARLLPLTLIPLKSLLFQDRKCHVMDKLLHSHFPWLVPSGVQTVRIPFPGKNGTQSSGPLLNI
ncbi:hypothetical protein CDAR_36231 [Caerostris darwini]|uniref:Uncharacterized protein n=1 Tax=Caerostris darwini TaxID=1538125 RepID=A0AAV4SDW9_9ARAC|nr:hypothetical protein CDAR_36231 [Caerostris darwini]